MKDLAGDWVSSLFGDSLTHLTGLDVLRFEIGFGSVGLHAEKKATENIRLLGDAEQTIRGNSDERPRRREDELPPAAALRLGRPTIACRCRVAI